MKYFILIGTSTDCNCSCFYCPVIKAKKPDGSNLLTTDEHKNILEQIDEIAEPKKNPGTAIGYIGGEPLLRDDIFELLLYARKKGFFTSILTNGILIDEQMVKQLKKAKLGFATITLDAINSEEFDKIKGKDSYNKVINAVKLLKKNNIGVIWSTHFSKESIYSGEQLNNIKKAMELGVDSYNLFEFLYVKNENNRNGSIVYNIEGVGDKAMGEFNKMLEPYLKLKSQTVPEHNEKVNLFNFLFNTYKKANWINFENGYQFNNNLNTLMGNCFCFPKIQFSISWFGDVQPCVGNKFSFGNIKEKPLKDILNYMWSHEIFDFRKEKNNQLVHNKYGFNLTKGCFSKYEAQLINKLPEYYKVFSSQEGYPIRIDKMDKK